MIDLAKAKTRRELFNQLEERMLDNQRRTSEGGPWRGSGKLLKSYLLESINGTSGNAIVDVDRLTDQLTIPKRSRGKTAISPQVLETDESGFYYVSWGRRQLDLFLDTSSDPSGRYWLAYSVADATQLDHLLQRVSCNGQGIDQAWLWPELLSTIQSRGQFRGIRFDYDHRRFDRSEGESTKYFKLHLQGGPDTKRILDVLQKDQTFSNRLVTAKVKARYDEAGNSSRYVVEEIKYNGKLTARGTSFEAHQHLLVQVRDLYADYIRKIEGEHVIRSDSQHPSSLQGEPIYFEFERHPIEDLDGFCGVVFNGKLPFRIWGIVSEENGGDPCRTVHAVDLHSGSKLFFEVYRDLILMYCYPGACGNSVARFYTNLQHHFSRLVKVTNEDGRSIF